MTYPDANKQKAKEAKDFKAMRSETMELQQICEKLESPVVFSHNDLLSGNVMIPHEVCPKSCWLHALLLSHTHTGHVPPIKLGNQRISYLNAACIACAASVWLPEASASCMHVSWHYAPHALHACQTSCCSLATQSGLACANHACTLGHTSLLSNSLHKPCKCCLGHFRAGGPATGPGGLQHHAVH